MTGLALALAVVAILEAMVIVVLLRRVAANRAPSAEHLGAGSVRTDDAPPVRQPGVRTSAADWVASRRTDVLVEALLEEWTDACVAASETGWVLGIPTGETLLTAWARRVGEARVSDPANAFAVWLVGEIGKASRNGLKDRETAGRRDVASRGIFKAAGRLLKGLSEDLELEPRAPPGVGPRHHDQWLIDTAVSSRIDNAVVGDFVQPIVVLRPLLRHGDRVLLEGEVA